MYLEMGMGIPEYRPWNGNGYPQIYTLTWEWISLNIHLDLEMNIPEYTPWNGNEYTPWNGIGQGLCISLFCLCFYFCIWIMMLDIIFILVFSEVITFHICTVFCLLIVHFTVVHFMTTRQSPLLVMTTPVPTPCEWYFR